MTDIVLFLLSLSLFYFMDITEAPVQKEEPVVVKAVPSGPGTTLGAPSGKTSSLDREDYQQPLLFLLALGPTGLSSNHSIVLQLPQ